jgi:DNA repair protein RecO (recombination protein O)
MDQFQTPALLAQNVEFGDLDRICTLITRDKGKLSALAKGARRSRKRYGGALSLFVIGEAVLRPTRRGELLSLERFDCQEDLAATVGSDIIKMAHGSYMLELARELLPPAQPDPQLFELLCQALRTLSRQDASPSLLRAFELQALSCAGVDPSLKHCVACGAEPAGDGLAFYPARGGILCARCASTSGPGSSAARAGAKVFLLDAAAYSALLNFQRLSMAEAAKVVLRREVAHRVREVMLFLIHQTLGKELRSLAFIVQLSTVQVEPLEG